MEALYAAASKEDHKLVLSLANKCALSGAPRDVRSARPLPPSPHAHTSAALPLHPQACSLASLPPRCTSARWLPA
jgi:hypothetical protein